MIEIRELKKSFGDRVLLDSLNMTFEQGKIYALIGESGSGKTTLLNIIAKLEPYDSGTITYDGEDLKNIKSHTYYRDVLGYLFQNFGLMESETVSANLELGFVGQKMSRAEKDEKKKEVLKKVKLSHLSLNTKIFEVSGGEAQRIALAKIFLKNPPLILADEPTAALDPATSDELMTLLSALKDDNRLIIIATHNPSIWKRADEVIRISLKKQKDAIGTAEDDDDDLQKHVTG